MKKIHTEYFCDICDQEGNAKTRFSKKTGMDDGYGTRITLEMSEVWTPSINERRNRLNDRVETHICEDCLRSAVQAWLDELSKKDGE